jgi:hypothetical protein
MVGACRPSSRGAAASTPPASAPAKTSRLTFVVANWVSSPRPMTGPASPRYAARNSPASASARLSGAVIDATVAMAPLNISPLPAPLTKAPAKKMPRLGCGSQTASVSRPSPASIVGIAAARSARGARAPLSNWASAAIANAANGTAPASAREWWCSVPARKLGASEVSSPNTAKGIAAAAAAAKNRPRASLGTDTRCGR